MFNPHPRHGSRPTARLGARQRLGLVVVWIVFVPTSAVLSMLYRSPWCALAILAYTIIFYWWLRGQQTGTESDSALINWDKVIVFLLNPIFVIIIALLLGDRLSQWQLETSSRLTWGTITSEYYFKSKGMTGHRMIHYLYYVNGTIIESDKTTDQFKVDDTVIVRYATNFPAVHEVVGRR